MSLSQKIYASPERKRWRERERGEGKQTQREKEEVPDEAEAGAEASLILTRLYLKEWGREVCCREGEKFNLIFYRQLLIKQEVEVSETEVRTFLEYLCPSGNFLPKKGTFSCYFCSWWGDWGVYGRPLSLHWQALAKLNSTCRSFSWLYLCTKNRLLQFCNYTIITQIIWSQRALWD